MTRRTMFRDGFFAVALLLLLDTAAWAFLCHRLEQGVRDAAAAAQREGWSIAAEATQWRGWPLAAAIELSHAAVAGAIPPGFVWRADRARVSLGVLHPKTISINVHGAQSVEADSVLAIPLTTGSTVIDIDLTGVSPVRAAIATFDAGLPSGRLQFDRADLTFPLNGIVADLTGLTLPGVATSVGKIHLRASIDPALPASPTPELAARAWRQAGGHIDIADAAVQWDTLEAAGSGQITLDEQLQPQADGTIEATGLPRLLDDLARAGTLAPSQAVAAKAVLSLLAAPSGGERVRLPVALEGGVLRLARFPLLRFPPLDWR